MRYLIYNRPTLLNVGTRQSIRRTKHFSLDVSVTLIESSGDRVYSIFHLYMKSHVVEKLVICINSYYYFDVEN